MNSPDTSWIQDVAEADFPTQVLQRSHELPVVVDFWAPWCGPCRMLGPMLEKAVAEREGNVLLAKVNIDEAQSLATEYGVQAIPMVIAFRDGKPILEFTGLLPEEHLRGFLDQIVPSPVDILVQQAGDAPAEAEAIYREALAKDPRHAGALLGLARLLVERGETTESADLLARLEGDAEHKPEVDRLLAMLSLRQLATECGSEGDTRKRLEREPNNAALKYGLGCALAAAGKYEAGLEALLGAAELDRTLAREKVRATMLMVFQVIGVRSDLADAYRDKLSRLLY